MKKILLLLCTLSCFQTLQAQYAVGHTTIVFNDLTRSGGFPSGGPNRNIQTEIYYPAISAGTNTPIALGRHPVIVFGHGFAMGWDSYAPLYNHWAEKGYVVALPRTEGGLIPAPDHLEFAKDLAFVCHQMQEEKTKSTSLFFKSLSDATAIGGHSMGGGCTYLAAPYQVVGINCMFSYAAAETNPSAIQAATTVGQVPSLLLSGSYDCVVPTPTQAEIYDSLNSSCKTHIELTDAYHCQFNAYNLTCATGEATCFTPGGIGRDTQIARTLVYTDSFLRYHLYKECDDWMPFMNLYNSNYGTLSSKQNSCTVNIPASPTLTFNGSKLETQAIYYYHEWFGNNNFLQGTFVPEYTVTQNANYHVRALSQNGGCWLQSPNYLLNNLSLEGDLVDQTNFTLGSSFLNIEHPSLISSSVHDIQGRQIMKEYGQKQAFDIGQLSTGVYVVIMDFGSRVEMRKILIP